MSTASSARHARPATRHTAKPAVIAAIAIPTAAAILTAGAWLIPPGVIPADESECRVIGGGTLRVETTCGTFLYRGHIDLIAGDPYAISHTGPLAWTFEEAGRHGDA